MFDTNERTIDETLVNSEKRFKKSKYVYLIQVFVIITIIVISTINITLYKNTDKIWIVLLSSCLGYLMPEPKYKIPQNARN